MKGIIFSALIYINFEKESMYGILSQPYLIGHGQFEISSEVLALCTYNVPKNGKFKLSFTQPLNVNEGKILPLERAEK